MAEFYCDHGAYGSYAATPTWSVPQDGDGLAKGPSTASATAQIVFTGVPSGSISICGLSFSPTWGATADTAANALATAINADVRSVTTTGFRPGVQLRNAVYARGPSTGAPAGTCQIMTRHGSAGFNGQVAIAHTLTNVDAGASALTFSGGVSGCWGVAWSAGTARWASAMTYYGVISNNPPLAFDVAGGDTIHIRGGRVVSGGLWGLDIDFSPTVAAGTIEAPVTIRFDDGTQWPEDSPDPVFRIIGSNTSARSFGTLSATRFYRIEATKYSDSSYGFEISWSGTQLTVGTGSRSTFWKGCHFYATDANQVRIGNFGSMALNNMNIWSECRVTHRANASYTNANLASWSMFNTFQNCVFSAAGSVVANTAGVISGGSGGVPVYLYYFDSCRFEDFIGGSRLIGDVQVGPFNMYARNCDFGGVTSKGPTLGVTANNQSQTSVVAASSQFGARDFMIDTRQGLVEWDSMKDFPVCNAKLLDGVTGWSMRVVPCAVSGQSNRFAFLETPRVGKINTLGDGIRTLVVELLVHEAVTADKSRVSAFIDYIDTAGVRQVVDTYSWAGDVLDASTAPWSKTTYVDGTLQNFVKRKFSVTTPTPIAADTEIGVTVRAHFSVVDVTKCLFVDPEIQVS